MGQGMATKVQDKPRVIDAGSALGHKVPNDVQMALGRCMHVGGADTSTGSCVHGTKDGDKNARRSTGSRREDSSAFARFQRRR